MHFQWDGPNTTVSKPVDGILAVNTSHDTPWQLLGVRYWKWHNPQCSPKSPK